jgi:transposase
MRRAYERDPVAVTRWLDEEYPRIREKARQEGAEIHWGDEMGVRSDHQAGRSYAPRGQTPVVPGTGQRFGFSVISSITNRGNLRFMVFEGRFSAEVFIDFMKRLVRDVGMIFLIVDRHPVHRAKKVHRWLKDRASEIRLFFLPAYSPDLNPDEYLNNDVKTNAVGRRRARNKDELKGNVRGYLASTQKRPNKIQRYFHADPVKYAS